MGLDNGIRASFKMTTSWVHIPIFFTHYAESTYLHNNKDEIPEVSIELIYWRKWWGVRNEVVRQFSSNQDEYKWDLDDEKIDIIISALKDFDDKETWDYEGQSIWDYEESNIHEQIQIDICVLEELKKALHLSEVKNLIKEGILEIYFYDSY